MSPCRSARRSFVFTAVLIAAAFPLHTASAAVIDSSYTGPANGLWSTSTNWNPNGSPINNAADQFNVTINATPNVFFDVAGSSSVNALTLTNAGLTLNAGANLSVLNSGSITGSTLFANGASFSGNAVTTLSGSDLTVFTGGSIGLGGITSYTTQSDSNNHAWFSAGTNASLSANNLTTIHLQGGGLFLLQAHNSGLISLPALTTLDQVGTRVFTLQAIDNGTINIPAFGSTAHSNISVDLRDGGTVTWGAPTTLTGSTISIRGAATLNTSALTNIDASKLIVANGATSPATPGILSLPSLVTYTGPSGSNQAVAWSATGSGSTLSANSLTTLNLSPNQLFVTAQDGGIVNLNALKTISSGFLTLQSRGAGSVINVPGFGAVIPNIGIDAEDGGSINWGAPTTLAGTHVSVVGGSSLNTAALTNIDGAHFEVRNSFTSPATPTIVSLPAAITSYTTPDDNDIYGFGAIGASSTFSANSLHTLNLPGSYQFFLSASSGATVNLNALATVVGPRSLRLSSTNGSTLNLPSLKSFTGDDLLVVETGSTANLGGSVNPFSLDFGALFKNLSGPLNILLDGNLFTSIPAHDQNLVDHYHFDLPGSSNAIVTFVVPGNGRVWISDFESVSATPGDANFDGIVNFSDFVLLSNHFGQSNTDWSGGDFNNDNITNFSDFVILSNHFGQSGNAFTATADDFAQLAAASASLTPSSIPEPASLALLALGVPAFLIRRRRRHRAS